MSARYILRLILGCCARRLFEMGSWLDLKKVSRSVLSIVLSFITPVFSLTLRGGRSHVQKKVCPVVLSWL